MDERKRQSIARDIAVATVCCFLKWQVGNADEIVPGYSQVSQQIVISYFFDTKSGFHHNVSGGDVTTSHVWLFLY